MHYTAEVAKDAKENLMKILKDQQSTAERSEIAELAEKSFG